MGLPRAPRDSAIHVFLVKELNTLLKLGSKGDAVMRALASHQCGPGSNPCVDAIFGLSLLMVLSFAPSGLSPGNPVFPSPPKETVPANFNSTRDQVDEELLCEHATSKIVIMMIRNCKYP